VLCCARPITCHFILLLQILVAPFVANSGCSFLFKIKDFDKSDTLARLVRFASHDKHTFCSSNGSHGGTGLKLSAVLNNSDKRNLHRIEDGLYPEKALPRTASTQRRLC
jgi:hypothetical protein